MKLTINEFDSKLNEYVKEKLIPNFKNPLYIFMASAALGVNAISVVPFLDKLEMLGIFDNGTIDIDKLDEFMKAGFTAVPTLELLGLRFTCNDYKCFRELI